MCSDQNLFSSYNFQQVTEGDFNRPRSVSVHMSEPTSKFLLLETALTIIRLSGKLTKTPENERCSVFHGPPSTLEMAGI